MVVATRTSAKKKTSATPTADLEALSIGSRRKTPKKRGRKTIVTGARRSPKNLKTALVAVTRERAAREGAKRAAGRQSAREKKLAESRANGNVPLASPPARPRPHAPPPKEERSAAARLPIGWGDLFRAKPVEWKCDACLATKNPKEAGKCQVCGVPRADGGRGDAAPTPGDPADGSIGGAGFSFRAPFATPGDHGTGGGKAGVGAGVFFFGASSAAMGGGAAAAMPGDPAGILENAPSAGSLALVSAQPTRPGEATGVAKSKSSGDESE